MIIKLNQNNTIDILLYLNYEDIIQIIFTNKYLKNLIEGAGIVWESFYLDYLCKKFIEILPKQRHNDLIDHYLRTNYSDKIICDLIYHDYVQFLKSGTLTAIKGGWMERVKETIRIVTKLVQQDDSSNPTYSFVHELPFTTSLRNRCGHASSVVKDLKNGQPLLVLFCGATDHYRMLNRISVVDLTRGGFKEFIPESVISEQWFCNSVVRNNNIYFLNGQNGKIIKVFPSSEYEIRTHPFRQVAKVDMNYISGSTMVIDSRPVVNQQLADSFRLIMFGGRNDLTREILQRTVAGTVMETAEGGVVEWSQVTVSGHVPPPRYNHSAQLIGTKMYLFGGWTNHPCAPPPDYRDKMQVKHSYFYNDLYCLDIDTMHWTKIETFGIPPSPRCQASMMYMPKRDSDGRTVNHYLVIASGANHDIRVRG